MLRGPISFIESGPPLLFVDGVRVAAEQADTLPLFGAIAPSRFDDIPVEDIARVEVLSGAAAAAYGEGAGGGVILVTTKSGGGPLRFGGRAQLLSGLAHDDYPANYRRRGTSPSTGQPVADCSLLAVAAHTCNPTGLDVWNPLEQASPFRSARSGLGHLSLSASPLGAALYASVSASQRQGVLPHDEASRLSYRARVERPLPWHLAVRASHAFRRDNARMGLDGGYTIANDVISNGLLGEAVNDANRGYFTAGGLIPPDSLYPDRRLRHTTSAVGVSWEPGRWLQASLLTGRDRVVDRWRLDNLGPVTDTLRGTERGADENWRLTTTGRIASSYSIHGSVTGSSALILDWWKNWIETSHSIGVSPVLELEGSQFSNRSRSVTLVQGFDWPRGISVNGSLHRMTRTFLGTEQPEWFPAANLSWRLAPLMRGRSTVRLRAAYAELPGAMPSLPTLFSVPVGPPQSGTGNQAKIERTKTLELGADASLDRLGSASVTLFRSTSTNLLDVGIGAPGGPALVLDTDAGEIRNSGVEALLHALLLDLGELRWTATVSLAALSNRVTRFVFPPVIGAYSITREGSALGAARVVPYTFADANHDGIIDVSEVQLLPLVAQPSLPTFEAGIGSELRLGHGLTVSALGDYRHGNMVMNEMEEVRCRNRRNCRAAQDPSTPLAEQAAVAAAVASGGEPVVGFMSDGSFFKLRELAIRWQLPRSWSPYFAGTVLTIAGRNLLTSTNHSGLDPEISTPGPGSLPREEFGRNPIPREIVFRLDVGAMSKN